MSDANSITEEFVRTNAVNASALSNAKKISSSGAFRALYKTDDDKLIYGDCYGSGSKPYNASCDFSGESVVFRCSCPSRQIPCKHCLGIMLDWLAGKEFTVADVPEDIARKREKIEKRQEKAAEAESAPPKKPNKSAAAKKLKKQREGLDLAEQFVKDILSRGVCSLNNAACAQYMNFAKQLGDYYLPEPQALVYQIVEAASKLSENPDDASSENTIALCVRLASTVKKSREYIDQKLESGEVLPEDSVLYEAMGGVWKLSQLKDIGLYKENASIMQLAFTVIDNTAHKSLIDTGDWIDMDSGDIYRTENIRPYKAMKYIQQEDSCFNIYVMKELYLYPGTVNRRIRWENSENFESTPKDCQRILSLAEESIASAVKKAKNELKNTLSRPYVVALIPFDTIGTDPEGGLVLKFGEESISLADCEEFPDACAVLKLVAGGVSGGAVAGALRYVPEKHRFVLCPFSLVTADDIIRL